MTDILVTRLRFFLTVIMLRRTRSISPSKLREKDVNISPQKPKQKLGFTIFQDTQLPQQTSTVTKQETSLGDRKPLSDSNESLFTAMPEIESDDKENEVSKENLEPALTADILHYDNILNNKILKGKKRGLDYEGCENPDTTVQMEKFERFPLSSKSIVLFPGFLEIADQSYTPSITQNHNAINTLSENRNSSSLSLSNNNREALGFKSKQRVLHLPRKSSPLKPVPLGVDQNNENSMSAVSTPMRLKVRELSNSPLAFGKESVNRKNVSIFASPASSPTKSKLTNKLLSIASSEEDLNYSHNNSKESVASKFSSNSSAISRSKSRLSDKSVLGIPNLTSFSSDSLQKHKVFKDETHYPSANTSPKKKFKSAPLQASSIPTLSARSSSTSLYSDYSGQDFALNSPSDKSISSQGQSVEDLRKIKRLDELWILDQNASHTPAVSHEIKKNVNYLLNKQLPNYITPPRMINKKLLYQLLNDTPDAKSVSLKSLFPKKKHFPDIITPNIKRSASSEEIYKIGKQAEYSSNLEQVLLNQVKRDRKSQENNRNLRDSVEDIDFGEGVNDGYNGANNIPKNVKVDSNKLKFTIFSD